MIGDSVINSKLGIEFMIQFIIGSLFVTGVTLFLLWGDHE